MDPQQNSHTFSLYQAPDFSFGFSIPSQKNPTSAFGFENQRSYDHLRNRINGTNTTQEDSNTSFITGLQDDVFHQFDALNFEFKLKF